MLEPEIQHMRCLCWWILAIWPLAAMGQAPGPGPKPAPTPDTLASIWAEEEAATKSFSEKVSKATNAAQANAGYEAYHTQMQSLMDQALRLARLHSGEPKVIAPTVWVVTRTSLLGEDDIAERGDKAFRILANTPVLDDPEIAWAMFGIELLSSRCPEIEPFLRSVISRSRNPGLVALARYYLGFYLDEMARMHDRLAAPISGPELIKMLTKDRLDRYRVIDGPKLRGEAEALLEQVIRENVDLGLHLALELDLGKSAEGELYRIRHLRIGQRAPELIGEDIDGAPIRLSDFRGKVVVLSFWPTLPSAFMLVFQEKDLVAAMKGRPFALVGVNGDAVENRAKVKDAVTKEGIPWRSFWAGGPHGAIPQKWGIDRWGAYGWRTVYTIDANGIIRDDQVGDKLTPAAFEPLVREAEKAAR
jgi:hypothetical protein